MAAFITRNDELFIKIDEEWIGPLSDDGVASWSMVEASDTRAIPDRMSNTARTEAVGVHRGNGEATIDINKGTKKLWYCGGKTLDYVHWRWVGEGRRSRKPLKNDETARAGWSKETGKFTVLSYAPADDSGGIQHVMSGKFRARVERADLP